MRRRIMLVKDDETFGLKAGELLFGELYHLDPDKVTVYRDYEGEPVCNVYADNVRPYKDEVRIIVQGPCNVGKSTLMLGIARLLKENGFAVAIEDDCRAKDILEKFTKLDTVLPKIAQKVRVTVRPLQVSRAAGGLELADIERGLAMQPSRTRVDF